MDSAKHVNLERRRCETLARGEALSRKFRKQRRTLINKHVAITNDVRTNKVKKLRSRWARTC